MRLQVSGEVSESARRGSQMDFLERLFRTAGEIAASLRGFDLAGAPQGSIRDLHDVLLGTVLLAQASGEMTADRLADRLADELLLDLVQHISNAASGLAGQSLERFEYRLRLLGA